MIEILQNTQATLDMIFSAGYTDATPPTYTVKDPDNNTVQSGTSTKDNATVGRYYFMLTPQTAPMWLTVTWTGTWASVSQTIATGAGQNDGTPAEVQVTGGHLFTLAQLRQLNNDQLSDTVAWPDEQLIDARSRCTVMFEDYCDVAFVPRYGRVVLDGTWGTSVWLPNTKVNRLKAITMDSVAQDITKATVYPEGKVFLAGWYGIWSGVTPQNVTVSYEHGYTSTPEDVAQAAMQYVAYEQAANKQLADRFITLTNEFGIVRQAIPGSNAPTGIPFVDATLNRYRTPIPTLA